MNAASTPMLSVARKTVGWSIALSVLMILSGILAIVIPPVAGLAVTVFVGWLLVFSGATHLVFAWQTRETGGLLWELLLSVLYVGVGIYLFLEGILEFVLAVRLRPAPGSGWLFVDGIITLILAFMIWRTWPSNTPWVIGVLVGISMLFSGIARLMLSLAARRLVAALD